MTRNWAAEPPSTIAFHRLLLRVSGQAPDELVVRARRWLADDWLAGVARALAFAALAGHFTVSEDERRLLTGYLAVDLPMDLPMELPVDGPGGSSRRPSRWSMTPGDEDVADAVAVDAVAGATGVAGVWRAVRVPSWPVLFPPPKRLFLVQARVDPAGLAARVQDALAAHGEADPLVEVFDEPSALADLGRRALDCAVLLWADRPPRRVRIAAAFDTYEPDGTPAFATGRPHLLGPEAEWVAAYLDAGAPLLTSPDLAPDVLDQGAARRVPTGLRGDGRWVWSDAAAYYLRTYGIAPDPDLLMAIRAAGYTPPEVDTVTAHRSRAAMLAGLDPAPVTPERGR